MTVSYVLAQIVTAVVQPAQDGPQDGWWKWVALSFIALLVVSAGSFAFLILRNWLLED